MRAGVVDGDVGCRTVGVIGICACWRAVERYGEGVVGGGDEEVVPAEVDVWSGDVFCSAEIVDLGEGVELERSGC